MSPHVSTVTKLCLKFMTFDPNYNYDDEEEEEDSMDVEEGLEEESDDEYSDDDDMSWKVRRSSIKCLESLIATRRDLLLSFFSSVCPALLARFKEREENVRADVFSAFSSLLRQTRGGTSLQGTVLLLHHEDRCSLLPPCSPPLPPPPEAFQPHMQVLLPPVVSCVEDSFYKITSEALLVVLQLVRVMRPQGPSAGGGFDPKPFVREVFSVTLKRLKATDIDQEVKERAISCMGHMVCHLGDHLGAELQDVLAIFLERLKNEITRLTAVRTLTLISASPLKIDLSSILPETLSVLGSFLRKNERVLKLGTLACLTSIITHQAANIKPAALEPVLSELPGLVDESDITISLSVLPCVFRLVLSPLLQGAALSSILDLLQALVLSNTSNLGYRQSYLSVSRCVAALSSSCPKETPSTVNGLLQEVGRSGRLGASKEVQGVILEAISSTNEEISTQPRRQYLLLELPQRGHQHCECPEGTRNLVAECLGKLTLVNAAQLLPRLKQQLRAGSPLARSMVVTAVKFTIVDHPSPIDALLKDCIGDFLQTLQDDDLNVRRVSLVMFNSAAHNKPSLIRGLLATVLPHLYRETQIRKDLIREVEMGPFKHTVDDGLDVRKAAFECMYTLLDSCMEGWTSCCSWTTWRRDSKITTTSGWVQHIEEMLTFLMLARLASLCPAAVLQRLDRLIEPLKATCTTKVKAGSVKQEFEKQEELRRSAMRAVAALLAVPEVERSPSMADFANQIRTNADMASIYQSVQGGEGGGIGPAESMDMS
ncbi:hypothetical protein KUCAC02_013397 [Chaenocephalus aceratus]|nr:hypothetical protein KUCAC02_013397 [Chaenocephalus aceratus]